MHDSAIKSFCTWARRKLISEVERRCAIYDISDNPKNPIGTDAVEGRVLSVNEKRQRASLIKIMQGEGFESLVERAAYTWFNRFMAIRFMELNDRLPSRTRLLSANDGSFKPQALTEALQVDIEGLDRPQVAELVQAGDDEATFRYLFIAQCAELAECMPDVFEVVGSNMELLLPDGLLRKDSVIAHLVEDIPEEDWTEGAEIVGWMYQYYVSERKDEYFASDRKATREDLAPATQLFTPEWIVRYLTDNSLGRLWMLNHPDSTLAEHMEYYIAPGKDAETGFRHVSSPEEITVVDPACGSGHILVYAFDLLASMYEEEGYSRRDIPQLILKKNLFGLEIDPRAAAMACFALTMKACEYDGRFLRRNVQPKITVLSRIEFDEDECAAIFSIMKDQERLDAPFLLDKTDLLDVLAHLDEAGSLFAPTEIDLNSLRAVAETVMDEAGMFGMTAAEKAKRALEELKPLVRHYDVVIANPPYLGRKKMNTWVSEWVEMNYPNEKKDLCTCFIHRGFSLAEKRGYSSMVTSQSWMFLGSFENMRNAIIDTKTICNMCHLGARAFEQISGEVVQTTATSFWNEKSESAGNYIRIVDSKDAEEKKKLCVEAIQNTDCEWFYRANQQDFKKIPSSPIAYWASESVLSAFENARPLKEYADVRIGMGTGKNEVFLRLWWEISTSQINFSLHSTNDLQTSTAKYYPYNKGGEYRLWYGNYSHVVWFDESGRTRMNNTSGHRENGGHDRYFNEGLTWTFLSSSKFGVRYLPEGFLFDVAGSSIFPNKIDEKYLLAFLASEVCFVMIRILNPTLNFQAGDIRSLPIFEESNYNRSIVNYVTQNIDISHLDWDSFETSWDFAKLPLIKHHVPGETLAQAYEAWRDECNERFWKLKSNEEELNRIFARIYDMEDEVPIEVPLNKVSVHIVFDSENDVPEELKGGGYVRTKADEIKSLVSYAVGCIMGRYSLDKPGLILANQGDGLNQYLKQVPNPAFTPDSNGIIPLTDVEYFHDDATGLFIDFMKTAFGEKHLEENLEFVANALGDRGTPRQVIREYFRSKFFVDHCKTYSVKNAGKRPIYWLFDSGKKGGFRALFYMHRYTPDLLARLRTEYVLPQQERYRIQLSNIHDAMVNADRRQMADLRKQHKKLSEQLDEINAYEEKVHHLADQMIKIDLDDGVSHNYALFQDILAKI